jgi:amino acid adenylation domain-containing protein
MNTDDFKKRLERLPPAQRALLEKRLFKAGHQTSVAATIPKIESSNSLQDNTYAFPLSFAQQRLWFLHQVEPGSATYNISTAYRLSGKLDITALRQSLDSLIQRHEVLRTTFSIRDGESMQIVHPALAISILITDLRGGDTSQQGEIVERHLQDHASEPFDLDHGPLFRVGVIQISKDEYVLHLCMHHIISDGWSMGVLFKELTALYSAYRAAKPSPLSDLPIQYADYAIWQLNWLVGEQLERQLSYWKKQLENLPTLQLPTNRPRPKLQTFCGKSQSIELSAQLSQAIKSLSQREGVTLFMTLLAAFQTLLSRYCGQDDIAIGTPIAGRTRQEIEGLIGFFVNTLVLRADLSNNPSFRQLLARVRQVALDAYDHQEIPFEKLVEELNPDRSLTTSPLFQVMFILQNAGESSLHFEGLHSTPIRTHSDVAKFDLTLTMSERHGSLRASLNYNTDLFDAATIERMLGHFQTLLEGIVSNPDRRISDLPLLTEAEKHQLVVEWNDTKKDYPTDKCVHQLFEDQVERTPEAVAVVFEDQQLTYRELNTRANQLAHYLRQQGIQPDTVVALCLERSLEMVIAILGVLKAGGAYLPIDPDLPAERGHFLLHDAQARLILTQNNLRISFADFSGHIVCLDREWRKLSDQSHDNPQHQVMGRNAAYVIYTSGSTGTPKGVINVHSGLLNRLLWMQETYRLTSADRVLQKTPFTFDVSVWEFLWPLISGASLIVARPGGHRDGAYLVELVKSQQITTLHFVPSMLEVFLQEPGVDGCTSLRQVICSGEALSYELQQRFFERSLASLHNLYGPTEASIDVTAWECRNISNLTVVPIGRPIANTQIYILDPHLTPVPIGVAGELHIGGDGLARGYLNRPELTAEKFIANPVSNEPGARLYKTGDLARYLPDGNIEFLGRMDNQVKIRGYRIELGEIEAVLSQHPAVQQAVVLARDDIPGDKRLIAYIVNANGSAPSAHDLRSYLQQKLPDYMMPSAFVFLDTLPLTPNGKLDRKALPAPDQSRADFDDAFVAPRTPVEEILANIWADVLKLDKVGIHDNFFHLGGHSLLATQVVSRVNHSFQINLPLRRLFETPTIAGLADFIQTSIGSEIDSRPLQPIVPVPHDNDIPLSFAQERLWFLDRLNPDSPTYNVPAAFRLAGDLNVNALEQSLNEVVRRHESLRTVFATVNGNPVQKILPSLLLSLTPIDLSNHPESERESALQILLKEQAVQPFDLSHGPLIRACLWRLAPDNHVLALNMHHVISDGWSMGVLFRELSALYQSYGAEKPTPLIDLPIQYADYSVWQRDWLQGENLDTQLSYWRKQLDGLSTLQLPTDHPRPPVQTYRGSSQSVELSAQLSQALKGLSQREGVTLFMTLLAAFQILLSRYCGQDDIAVGTPIAGRTRREIEGLIGFFVNTLVLRADFSDNPTFKELVRQVRETTLEAYTHQDLPFEKLVEELHPERNSSISPLFQVMFILQNNTDRSLEIEHLAVSPIRTGGQVAKFDITLSITERVGALRASLRYNTDLFDAATIDRMLGHFQTLLEGIVANSGQPISELPLLTPAERHQLIVEWNETRTDLAGR